MSSEIHQRLFAVLLGIVLVLSLFPAPVAAQEAAAWVLVDTTVNPSGATFPYESESGTVSGPPVEGRYEGTVIQYDISETAMTYRNRYVDYGVEYYDATFSVNLDSPPSRLVPGETVELSATVGGSGSVSDEAGRCWSGIQFEFRADGVGLSGTTQHATCLDFTGGTVSPSFVVPPVREGGEIRILAFLWNCGACAVEWVYRPAETAGEADGDEEQDEPEACLWESVAGEREQIGFIAGVFGTVELSVEGCDEGVPVERGMPVYRDDVVRTDDTGRVRIELLPDPVTGGKSVVNVGPNSALTMDPFADDRSYWEILRGSFHYWTENWGRQSIFTSEVAICGIRGSEVMMQYDPDTERFNVYVKEGVVNLTHRATGAELELTAGQKVVLDHDGIGTLASLSNDEWNSVIGETEVAEELAGDVDSRASFDELGGGADDPNGGPAVDGPVPGVDESRTESPPLNGFTAVVAVISLLTLAAAHRWRRPIG